jgi:hypothetical protein
VYNVEIEEFHTYFVGSNGWGFEVWVHNAYALPITPRAPHGGRAHNGTMVSNALGIQRIPGVTGIRTNQALVDLAGRTLSRLRPDIHYIENGLIHIVEVSTWGGTVYLNNREQVVKQILGNLFGLYKSIVT